MATMLAMPGMQQMVSIPVILVPIPMLGIKLMLSPLLGMPPILVFHAGHDGYSHDGHPPIAGMPLMHGI
jgi:hypothetical protein